MTQGSENMVGKSLSDRRGELAGILASYQNWSQVEAWAARVRPVLQKHFASHLEEFDRLMNPRWSMLPRFVSRSGRSNNAEVNAMEQTANTKTALGAIEQLIAYLDGIIEISGGDDADGVDVEVPIDRLANIFARFHSVARQLRDRHAGRPTLDVADEYDVQDLLHGVLKLHFDDIRPEDYVPSYAGGNSRIDFLLKPERAMVEVKMTRPKLGAKEIGEELAIDVARYSGQASCDVLVCFVYDPGGHIANPAGLANDLEALSREGLAIRVFIYPA